jgi:hypothetical protein
VRQGLRTRLGHADHSISGAAQRRVDSQYHLGDVRARAKAAFKHRRRHASYAAKSVFHGFELFRCNGHVGSMAKRAGEVESCAPSPAARSQIGTFPSRLAERENDRRVQLCGFSANRCPVRDIDLHSAIMRSRYLPRGGDPREGQAAPKFGTPGIHEIKR